MKVFRIYINSMYEDFERKRVVLNYDIVTSEGLFKHLEGIYSPAIDSMTSIERPQGSRPERIINLLNKELKTNINWLFINKENYL